jgi:hypothetical protein
VVEEIVTVCAEVYVPPNGLNVGVATAGAIVYAAEATALLLIPLSYAIALIVSAALTVTVTGEALPPDALGALPLVV